MGDEDGDTGAGSDQQGEARGAASAGGAAPSVDELFARIRAASDSDVAVEPVRAPGRGGDGGVGQGLGTTAVVIEVEEEIELDTDDEAEAEAEAEAEGPDAALIAQRDDLLSPISAQLSSHIKRALGDDQNRLLDVLRNSPNLAGEALLGPEDLHLSMFITAAQGHLSDAFSAGTVFGGGEGSAAVSNGAAEQAAAGLARTVVTMLRRRIMDGGDNGEEAADRVGSAFREWRGERIERLVGDFAVQAFSAGVAASSSSDGMVRWVMTSATGCSDCDDNALAGAVPLADGFPTGHAYPPAHSGCRCLVAPVEP